MGISENWSPTERIDYVVDCMTDSRFNEGHRDEVNALKNLTRAGTVIDEEKLRIVGLLRDQEVPWSTIGDALFTTKQAAQQKYTKALGESK